MRRLLRDKRGLGAFEYALILIAILLIVVGGFRTLGGATAKATAKARGEEPGQGDHGRGSTDGPSTPNGKNGSGMQSSSGGPSGGKGEGAKVAAQTQMGGKVTVVGVGSGSGGTTRALHDDGNSAAYKAEASDSSGSGWNYQSLAMRGMGKWIAAGLVGIGLVTAMFLSKKATAEHTSGGAPGTNVPGQPGYQPGNSYNAANSYNGNASQNGGPYSGANSYNGNISYTGGGAPSGPVSGPSGGPFSSS